MQSCSWNLEFAAGPATFTTSGEKHIQKWLIIVGLFLVAIGVAWPVISKLGLGRLPGDIAHEGENIRVYFPIVTCLLLSAMLSAIFWLMNRGD